MVLGLAAAMIAADASWKALEASESAAEFLEPVSVPRARLKLIDGRFHREGSREPFTGTLTDRSRNGALRHRASVVGGWYHGRSEEWSAPDVLEVREYYRRGLPHGVRTTWHPNGQKRSEGRLALGLQQGVYRQWTESGALAAEAMLEDGKPHGPSRAWYPSGWLKAEAMMNRGELVTRRVYPDGAQRAPTLFAGGIAP
jgi:antitoxin component YwqK of YwqJK toxin-antitoxin module